jgi:nucleoside-diphosphate-sugar epimerase
MKKSKVLITGSGGFIGSALCRRFMACAEVIALDVCKKPENLPERLIWAQVDITQSSSVEEVCRQHSPDVIIHCAGLAHQKAGTVNPEDYIRINSRAAEGLARLVAENNPEAWFIFLSSISVYGEDTLNIPVTEDSPCYPSSDYAVSKYDAEKRLLELCRKNLLRRLTILRLAPVYDRCWSLNLDRRVFGPHKLVYLRFGSGEQRMSALARANLVDFIEYLLTQSRSPSAPEIMNVCDMHPYEFNSIINAYKHSGVFANRATISVPLKVVWLMSRMAGLVLPKKKKWLHSGYDKLASSLIFDNTSMLSTGFSPKHNLETVFHSENTE